MDFTNYLTLRSSNLASMRATHLALSTLTGSTLAVTSHITAPTAVYSTMIGSSIAVSTLTGSTLFGSTLVMSSIRTSFLTLSTLLVSSINNNVPGTFSTLAVSSLVSASTITTSSIHVAGNIVKLGTTSGNDVRIEGGTVTNSGYVNFVTGGTSRGYIGNASATDVDVVAQNGARLNFYTGGTNRIMINTAGQTDFYGNVSVNDGVGGTLTKFGSTAGYYGTFTGGTADNSPFLEFWANGSRRCYMGNANTTEVQFASENGARFNFLTAGISRFVISTNGSATFANNLATNGNFAANTSIANINGGTNFAVLNNYMAVGSLTIGDPTKNYGGGTSTWNTNTAGLMMECLTNTEIAVHDAADRVTSLMYYSGNTITLGRDMGWGVANTTIPSGAVFTQKGGNSGANFFNIQGNDLSSSPYLGFYFNNTRRCYMGNTTATNVDIIAENGAQLSLGTGGVSRMTIDSAGDTSTTGKLTVQDVIRFGNYSGGNYDNIQFMRGTGAGQFPNIRCQNNYIGMYSSGAGGWISGSAVGDMTFLAEAGRNIRLSVGGSPALVVNSANDVIASNNLSANCLIINGGGTYQAGCIYSDINWGMLFRAKVAPSSGGGIFGWYDSAGTEKMKMLTDGSMTHTSGNESYMRYGPNSQWGAYLTVGASPDRAGIARAQVITTNGNLHLDAGDSNAIYYGHYASGRGTPNPHYFYGGTYDFHSVPQNNDAYSHVACFYGNTLRRSQCLMRQVYRNDGISWGGGIDMTYAFYKYNALCPVKISGKYSGYATFVGFQVPYIRIYSRSSGIYYYFIQINYQNHTYSQTTIPFEHILTQAQIPETGWFDIYMYNASNMETNTDSQLHVNVQLLPVGEF